MRQRNPAVIAHFVACDAPLARQLATLAISCAFLTYLVAAIRGNTSLLQIGSYNLCAEDVAVVPLLAAVVSRMDVTRISLFRILLCLALLLAFLNLLIGVAGPRSFAALFAFRSRIVFLLFFAFVLTRWSTLRPMEYLPVPLVLAASAFLAVYLTRLVGGPLVLVDPESFGALHAEYLEGRLINAEAVIFLGAATAFFVSEGTRKNLRDWRRLGYWALAAISVVVVMLSRQRTGTAAVIAGLCTLLLLHPTLLGGKRSLRLLAGLSLLGALFVAAVTAAGDVLEVFPQSFRESILKRDTFYGRLEIWGSSLAAYSNWSFWWRAFGRPAGEPLVLPLEQGDWEYSIHNAYLGLLLDYGFVGALLWTITLLAALAAALRKSHEGPTRAGDIQPSVAASWLIILLIYGFSYEWRNAAGVFLGMAAVSLVRRRPLATPRQRRSFQGALVPTPRLSHRLARRI